MNLVSRTSIKLWEDTYRVLPKRGFESELVKCQALATSLLDPCSCSFCELQCSHFQRRNFTHPNVIGDCPNHHSNLSLLIEVDNNVTQKESSERQDGSVLNLVMKRKQHKLKLSGRIRTFFEEHINI